MIGIIPKADQTRVIEEFFELFKTPWEIWRPGQVYDVVIASADEIPEVKTKLLVVYGPTTKGIDAPLGVAARGRHHGAILSDRDTTLPIYGDLLTFADGGKGISCITASSEIAGLRIESPDSIVIRLGYDVFDEVQFLLTSGQPVEQAPTPTLDLHIKMLREWILQAGISLLEIPPTPAQHSFIVCLTHDIDFVGIRNHLLDHSMWGFAYRATVGALGNFLRGRLSLRLLLGSWLSAVSLPFVYVGWAKDFWEPFEWYLEVEKGLPSTYFLIPFKHRPGEKVPGNHASRRATAYDVGDVPHRTSVLLKHGCEIGVHGIDSWHSQEKGRSELARVAEVTGGSNLGIRVHWLLRDEDTFRVLEDAGYDYDSSVGYNETVGYRAGTSQVFRPLGAQTLLELPLHIHDGALFFPERLDLSDTEAETHCQILIGNACKLGGVITLLWHDRSHGPERFWGDSYIKLLQRLKSLDGWFGTASQVVGWFRKRREVHFVRVQTTGGTLTRVLYEGNEIQPPLKVRVYTPSRRASDGQSVGETEFIDIPWSGKSVDELESQIASRFSRFLPEVALPSVS